MLLISQVLTNMPYNRTNTNSLSRKACWCFYSVDIFSTIFFFKLYCCLLNAVPEHFWFLFFPQDIFLTLFGYRVGQMEPCIFSFSVCVVWTLLWRWWCCSWCYYICVHKDQHMVCIATKTCIVYMCITYVLCIYICNGYQAKSIFFI